MDFAGSVRAPGRAGSADASRGLSGPRLVAVYSGTLLLAAFLLFSLQPLFAKRVLPILGGTPAVWSVATVVFQGLLLAGYAYAFALTRWVPLRAGMILHGLVLAAGFLALPVAVAAGYVSPPPDAEASWLVGLFLASVGLPFFALSASAPLLQAWFARSNDARAADPYFLYRASNTGSFVALIAYPLLVEPLLGLDAQSQLWSIGYAVLACAVLACAFGIRAAAPAATSPVAAASVVRWPRRLAWIGLSAVPSGLLVAATAHISTDVAAIPLLWVVPLALYLLSFIVAFRPGEAWPARALAAVQVIGTAIALILPLRAPAPLPLDLGVTLALLLVNALIAHRAVYRLRPPSGRLTEFYLCTSFGGMLGGLFAALVAPVIFSGIYEYPILLVAALACRPGVFDVGTRVFRAEGGRLLRTCTAIAVLAGLVWAMEGGRSWAGALIVLLTAAFLLSLTVPLRSGLFGAALGIVCAGLPLVITSGGADLRSFFGLHRIRTTADGQFRTLSHGTTLHGAMRIRDEQGTAFTGRPEPITYYAEGSPLSDVLAISRAATGPIPSISVVGLGSGSLACHTRADEALTYYEIDPTVIRLATNADTFRFLSECAPDARILQGDARLTLARSRQAARVLIVDAFSSDAIPVHLLTAEALDVDLAHLDAQGVLAFHISNRHFELRHVLARLAIERGLTLMHRWEQLPAEYARTLRTSSSAVLMTRDAAVVREAMARGWAEVPADFSRRPWTDDYANALEAMVDRWNTSAPDPIEKWPLRQ